MENHGTLSLLLTIKQIKIKSRKSDPQNYKNRCEIEGSWFGLVSWFVVRFLAAC
jgi:hypothetical protein